MHNKIFIIHSSAIISHGLNSIIKDHFDIESILLPSVEDLKNYFEIDAARVAILVDTALDNDYLSSAIKTFRKVSDVKKIVIISDGQTKENDNTDCISINAPKSAIHDLLNQYLHPKINNSQIKKSTLLTERETDVLKLVAFGKINKEIANELFISIHTVISHRKNITEKLGIKSISGLTVYAILNKLIDTTTIDPESLI